MGDLVVDLLSRLAWASAFLTGAGVLACVMCRLLRVKSPGILTTIWWVVLLDGLLLFGVNMVFVMLTALAGAAWGPIAEMIANRTPPNDWASRGADMFPSAGLTTPLTMAPIPMNIVSM